jgi:hypothetical protein
MFIPYAERVTALLTPIISQDCSLIFCRYPAVELTTIRVQQRFLRVEKKWHLERHNVQMAIV